MLPFTKRSGRAEESGEVLTKESLSSDAKPASSDRPRAFAKSVSDEELTTLMPSKGIPGLAALSRPASVPPPPRSARSTAPPPARSVPPPRGKFMDEDEGRTAVRAGPKIVKKGSAPPRLGGMNTGPTTVSPQAVIKATLESAGRTGRRNDLMAPPPADLLEDLADRHPADAGPQQTVQLANRGNGSGAVSALGAPRQMTPVGIPGAPPSSRSAPPPPVSRSVPPPPASRSVPPPPASRSVPPALGSARSGAMGHGQHPYAPYGAAPPSGSAPPVAMSTSNMPPSMPAHFMVPNAPYSDGRLDPPGTVVTARGKSQSRPAASWAMALLVVGLGVGLGGVALMRGNADGLLETTAAFVDPARAAAPRAAAAAPAVDPAAAPVAEAPKVAVPPAGAVPPAADTAQAVAPTVTVPATPAAQPAVAPAAAAPAAHTAVATAPAAPAHVAAAAPAAPVRETVTAPAPKPVAVSAPAPRPAPPPVVAAPRPAPPPAPKPVAVASTSEDAPVETAKKPAKGGKGTKGAAAAGSSDIDEETKKALEALQKSQLESSF